MLGMLLNPRSRFDTSIGRAMVRIVLIRPGITDYTQQRRIQGTLDVPLNEEGVAEVKALSDHLGALGIEVVYSPACDPAQQTAQTLADLLGVKHKKLERMKNLNLGLWQGMSVEEIRHKQPKVYRQWQEQPEIVCPPEGEMLAEADSRVRAAMSRLLKRHREGVIGVVLPEPLASLARRFLLRCELGDLWKAAGGHAAWEIVDADSKALVSSP